MKKSGSLFVLALVVSTLAIAAAGCGGSHNDDDNGKGSKKVKGADSKDTFVGSCDQTFQNGAHLCTDALNGKQDDLNAQCHQNNGVVSTNACTTDGRVGTCDAKDGGFKVLIRFYPPTTVDQAKGACQQNGGNYTDG